MAFHSAGKFTIIIMYIIVLQQYIFLFDRFMLLYNGFVLLSSFLLFDRLVFTKKITNISYRSMVRYFFKRHLPHCKL